MPRLTARGRGEKEPRGHGHARQRRVGSALLPTPSGTRPHQIQSALGAAADRAISTQDPPGLRGAATSLPQPSPRGPPVGGAPGAGRRGGGDWSAPGAPEPEPGREGARTARARIRAREARGAPPPVRSARAAPTCRRRSRARLCRLCPPGPRWGRRGARAARPPRTSRPLAPPLSPRPDPAPLREGRPLSSPTARPGCSRRAQDPARGPPAGGQDLGSGRPALCLLPSLRLPPPARWLPAWPGPATCLAEFPCIPRPGPRAPTCTPRRGVPANPLGFPPPAPRLAQLWAVRPPAPGRVRSAPASRPALAPGSGWAAAGLRAWGFVGEASTCSELPFPWVAPRPAKADRTGSSPRAPRTETWGRGWGADGQAPGRSPHPHTGRHGHGGGARCSRPFSGQRHGKR